MNPFKIIEIIDKKKKIFKLKLLSIIKIHSMIFITQFELITNFNLYNRLINVDSFSIINEYANTKTFFYKIEKLFDKRIIRNKIYYLIK